MVDARLTPDEEAKVIAKLKVSFMKKVMTLYNKRIKEETIKGISKMNKAEITKLFNNKFKVKRLDYNNFRISPRYDEIDIDSMTKNNFSLDREYEKEFKKYHPELTGTKPEPKKPATKKPAPKKKNKKNK